MRGDDSCVAALVGPDVLARKIRAIDGTRAKIGVSKTGESFV